MTKITDLRDKSKSASGSLLADLRPQIRDLYFAEI